MRAQVKIEGWESSEKIILLLVSFLDLPDNIRPPYKTQTSMKIKAFKITDQDMNDIGKPTPIKLKTIHENEIISSYQVSKNSFISICTLTGKLVVLSVHLLASNQIETGDNANITTDKSLVSPSVRNPDVDQVVWNPLIGSLYIQISIPFLGFKWCQIGGKRHGQSHVDD